MGQFCRLAIPSKKKKISFFDNDNFVRKINIHLGLYHNSFDKISLMYFFSQLKFANTKSKFLTMPKQFFWSSQRYSHEMLALMFYIEQLVEGRPDH